MAKEKDKNPLLATIPDSVANKEYESEDVIDRSEDSVKSERQEQVERAANPSNKLSDILNGESPSERITQQKSHKVEPQKSHREQTHESREQVTKQRANMAFEDYYNMRKVRGNNFTTADVDAVLGNNTRAFQKVYGEGKGNFGTALGAGAIWGAVNTNTLATLDRMYQERLAKEQREEANKSKMSSVIGKFGSVNITNGDKRTLVSQFGDTNGDVKMTPELKAEMVKRGITDENDQLDMIDLLNQKPPTFEELMAQREQARAELDYKNQQRLIERKRNLQGLSELGAMIGDIIKASGGAVVTPRDLSAKYDQLSKQEQANYNAYLARMEKIKADAEAERKRQAERAQALADRDETRAYNEKLYQQKLKDDAEIAAQKQQYQLDLIDARSKARLAELTEKIGFQMDNKELETVDIWFDTIKPYKVKKDSLLTTLSAIRPIVGLGNDELSKLLGNDDTATSIIAETCNRLVEYAESSYLTEEQFARIKSILSGGIYVPKATAGGSTGAGANTGITGTKSANDTTGGMFE